jgi:hypothetical protein
LMPTSIVGQNGVQVKQSTRVAVTGCAKAKPAKKKKAKKKAKPARKAAHTSRAGKARAASARGRDAGHGRTNS